MYMPTWLSGMYFDYFTNHGPVLLSDSAIIFQMFMPSVYPESVLNMISDEFFQGQMPSPNAGMFAEAIMQFGPVGVIFFPFLLFLVCSWSNRVYCQYGLGISILIASKFAIQLTNVPLLRTDFVLSFGLFTFAAMLITFFSTRRRVGITQVSSKVKIC